MNKYELFGYLSFLGFHPKYEKPVKRHSMTFQIISFTIGDRDVYFEGDNYWSLNEHKTNPDRSLYFGGGSKQKEIQKSIKLVESGFTGVEPRVIWKDDVVIMHNPFYDNIKSKEFHGRGYYELELPIGHKLADRIPEGLPYN